MVNERGLDVHHTTVYRWVQQYGPELEKRCRPHSGSTNNSWRVDETYVKIKGKDRYLYRAVDSQGKTLDFLLTAHRDAQAAKRFLRKAMNAVVLQKLFKDRALLSNQLTLTQQLQKFDTRTLYEL